MSTLSSPISPINHYQIILGENIKVTEDRKSKTRVINFPFEFPDDTRGVLILCRVKDEAWIPHKTIKSINIEFNG